MKMQKRIETDWYVLELKEPEKVEGVAIAVSVSCEEEDCFTNNGGVIGKKGACLSAAETVLTATIRNLLNEGLQLHEVFSVISKMCAQATARAASESLKIYSPLDENGAPIEGGELN